MTISLLFFSVRCFGVRLVDIQQDNGVGSNEAQFSIRQLMILTAATAATAAVARWLAPLTMTVEAMMYGAGIAVCLGVLALGLAWGTLRCEISRKRSLVLAVVSLMTAGSVYYVMEVTEADPGLVWGCVVVVYSAALSAAFLYARALGIRLLADHESRVDAV